MKINKFKNAFGIKELNVGFTDNELKNVCVYASNGIFKSSFSRAIYSLGEGEFTSIGMSTL